MNVSSGKIHLCGTLVGSDQKMLSSALTGNYSEGDKTFETKNSVYRVEGDADLGATKNVLEALGRRDPYISVIVDVHQSGKPFKGEVEEASFFVNQRKRTLHLVGLNEDGKVLITSPVAHIAPSSSIAVTNSSLYKISSLSVPTADMIAIADRQGFKPLPNTGSTSVAPDCEVIF